MYGKRTVAQKPTEIIKSSKSDPLFGKNDN
jgi:hypothetical protein